MINRKMTRRDLLRKAAIGAAIPFAATAAAGNTPRGKVKILELGDLHVLDNKSSAYPRKVIQAMNEEGGDLVLACGDLATKGKKAELLIAKNILKGNSYHFVKKDIHFLAVDHGCGKAYGKNDVRPQVMAWIHKTLAQIPAHEPIVFFSHYPFGKGVRYQTRNAAEVVALFKNKNLLAMIGAQYLLCILLVLAGSFSWALLLVLVFAVQLGWLPASGNSGLSSAILPIITLDTGGAVRVTS